MGVGPSNLVLAVNSKVAVYTKTGVSSPSKSLSTWFSSVGTTGLTMFDPWVVYDIESGRFFLLTAGTNSSTREAYLFLSVSQSSDAESTWCNYKIGVQSSTDLNSFADYPKLGVDSRGVYITANMHFFSNSDFQYAKLWVYDKSNLTSCSNPRYAVFYDLRNNDNTLAFTVQPAIIRGTSSVEYMVNAHVPLSSYPGGDALTLWSVTCCSSYTASRVKVSVSPYSAPPDAPQLGSTLPIDTIDGRLMNAVYYADHLWTTHATEHKGASAVRVYRIFTPTSTAVLSTRYDFLGRYYFNPSVTLGTTGSKTMLVFNRSSTSEYAGIWYGKLTGSRWSVPVSLKAGEGPSLLIDSLGRNRWGDYAGSAPDPDGGNLWMYSQYGKTIGGWGTWVGATQ